MQHGPELTGGLRLYTPVTGCFDCRNVKMRPLGQRSGKAYRLTRRSKTGCSERRSMAPSLTDVQVAPATRRSASLGALDRTFPGFLRCAGGRLGYEKGTKKEIR